MTRFVETAMQVQIFPGVLEEMVHSENGPVGRQIQLLANQVLEQARTNIGGGLFHGHHTGRYGNREGGTLRASGSVQRTGTADRMVVFDHPYAYGHHVGAPPHVMERRDSRYMGGPGPYYRRVPSPVSYRNKIPFATHGPIHHPGHHGNPYLTDAARQVGLQPHGRLFQVGTGLRVPLFSP